MYATSIRIGDQSDIFFVWKFQIKEALILSLRSQTNQLCKKNKKLKEL